MFVRETCREAAAAAASGRSLNIYARELCRLVAYGVMEG